MIRQAMRFAGLVLVLGIPTAGRADSPLIVRKKLRAMLAGHPEMHS